MRLLNFLKNNPNTRKIFGKRELKIIEKQLLGINLTQSEKNRLSRDIRKKFEFIEKASYLSEEFKLKKGAIINDLIQKTKEIILDNVISKKIKTILLYGSAAKNTLTFKSDIDIVVEFTDINKKQATLFRKEIQGKIDEKVNIEVYNHLPNKIKESIKDNHKILHQR